MRASTSNQGALSSVRGTNGISGMKNYTTSIDVKPLTILAGSCKPPIAPKPALQSRHRSLIDPKTDYSASSQLISDSFTPLQRYSTFPSAVLIGDESDSYDQRNSCTMEKLLPLPLTIPNPVHKEDLYNGSHPALLPRSKGILPPLTKAEIIPRHTNSHVNSHINHFLNNSRTGTSGRTMSASAKNALLMEKIRGNISFHEGVIQAQSNHKAEILPRANSNPETHSLQNNKTCVVTVNNCLNNYNNSYNNNVSQNFTTLSINTPQEAANSIKISSLAATSTCDNSPKKTFDSCLENESHNSMEQSREFILQNQIATSKSKDIYDDSNSLYKSDSSVQTNGISCVNVKMSSLVDIKFTLLDNRESQETASIQNGIESTDTIDHSCDTTNPTIPGSSENASSLSAPCSPAAKPQLQKSDAFDIEDSDYYKRLSRGISRATDNVNIVSKARSEIAQGILEAFESGKASSTTPFFLETPVFTFTLPELSLYSVEFRTFLEKDLIEMSTLVSLEAAGRLNWWAMIGSSHRLWPLATSGDGNCLLHAASLGMWGFHDRLLTLRRALHDFLQQSPYRQAIWRRWRWQVAMQYKETGLIYSEAEWESEWENVLRLSSSAPRVGSQPQEDTTNCSPCLSQTSNSLSQEKLNVDGAGAVYESLEEIHVLALAHVLRRPIIVVADTTLKDMNGDPLAPIPFGGIYLPLEIPHRECQRSPLLLTYDAAHFSALVVMENSDKNEDSSKSNSGLPAVIPVTDCTHELLPIQFLVDPGDYFVWGRDEVDDRVIEKLTLTNQDKKGLLNEYLDLTQVPIPSNYLEAATSYCGQDRASPDSIYGDQNDLDKKSPESSFDSDDGPPFIDLGLGLAGALTSKVKAPKQLQTVVKSFGSISRSVSKRIKKNLSKFGRAGSFRKKSNFNKGFRRGSKNVRVSTHQNFILAAQIHIDKRHAYQEEMIENYLATAKERFLRESNSVKPTIVDRVDGMSLGKSSDDSEAIECINAGCTHFGTAETSYMCSACFTRQKEQEEKEYQRQFSGEIKPNQVGPLSLLESQNDPYNKSPVLETKCDGPQYGAGKSKFYASLDEQSMINAKLIPTTQSLSTMKDKTLFLSNSTFYNDTSSIPSYNLNKDLRRDQNRVDLSRSKQITDSLARTSSLTDSVQISRIIHENGSLKHSNTRDSLAPICIDNNAGGQLNRPNSPISISKVMLVDSKINISGANDFSDPTTKNCLTKGCPFYGNSATNSFCSKCHNSLKKKVSGNC